MRDFTVGEAGDGHQPSAPRRPRLDKIELHPWMRAQTMEDCYLYWMPVHAFPLDRSESTWLIEFMDRFSRALDEEHNLRAEIFLQFRTASNEVSDSFRAYSMKCKTLLGLGRKPGADLPSIPTKEELEELAKDGKSLDPSQWVGDYCYWFRTKRPEEQRRRFLGYGGMTTLFLLPDPKTTPPRFPFTPRFRAAVPAFSLYDIDSLIQGAFSLKDGFLQKSKSLFGAGLEDKPEYSAIMYIIPLLASGHFFAVSADERSRWFQLFDVYLNESPNDRGVLLAFQKNYEPLLIETLRGMKADGLLYPQLTAERQ